MHLTEMKPFFTVIIPTRNRPELFKIALDSVLAQTFELKEVVVVNDGSDADFLAQYKTLEQEYQNQPVQFRYQIKRPNGHGQSYSMNTGAYVGKGEYLCFLDDDDLWTDPEHLQRAYSSIKESDVVIDAYYSNQTAFFSDGTKNNENVWIEDLADKLDLRTCDKYGSCLVNVPFLLTSGGFAHLNCSIIRKQLYLDIKGMDENIRYECDRDIYLRTLDASVNILYNPKYISKHHIPDKNKKNNMSTTVSAFEKYIYQIVVYEKAILLSKNKAISVFSNNALSYIYKHISIILKKNNDFKNSYTYAKKALSLKSGIKWLIFTISLAVLHLRSRR